MIRICVLCSVGTAEELELCELLELWELLELDELCELLLECELLELLLLELCELLLLSDELELWELLDRELEDELLELLELDAAASPGITMTVRGCSNIQYGSRYIDCNSSSGSALSHKYP